MSRGKRAQTLRRAQAVEQALREYEHEMYDMFAEFESYMMYDEMEMCAEVYDEEFDLLDEEEARMRKLVAMWSFIGDDMDRLADEPFERIVSRDHKYDNPPDLMSDL